jgi:hypothetical protein
MVELEKAGIPTAVILSDGFQADADASARAFGMGPIPRVEVPLVYNNITTAEAFAQTEPVVPDIVRLLTTQVSGESIEEDAVRTAQSKREIFTGEDQLDALEVFNEAFIERDWGDGFPLIPPTPDRVEHMLTGTTLSPDEVVCTLPPGNGIVTVQKVAANCVMAGARPEHLPVVIAACRALANMDPFEARGLLMSTSAGAPLLLVNGPIIDEIGLNSKRAALGPGKISRVNVVIGRAFTLTLKNGGHWYPGVLDMDTIGTPRKFSLCVGENEDDTPWEPWHVERGFSAEQSTLTIFPTGGEHDHGNQGVDTPDGLLRSIANSCNSGAGYIADLQGEHDRTGAGQIRSGGGTLILMAPAHARPISAGGYSKAAAKEFLHHHVRVPASKPMSHFNVPDKVRFQYRWLYDLSEKEREEVMLPGHLHAGAYHIVCVGAADRAKNLIVSSGDPSIIEITDRVTN